jgi:hypothetical protein
VSPNDDDPLVWQAAVDQLRRERSSGPSHVEDGGGDASQVDIIEVAGYEKPTGLSHVVDGSGATRVSPYGGYPTINNNEHLRG